MEGGRLLLKTEEGIRGRNSMGQVELVPPFHSFVLKIIRTEEGRRSEKKGGEMNFKKIK